MPEPILLAETIITTALRNALAPLVDTYNGRAKAYWLLAEKGAPLPYTIFQAQSDITRLDRIGDIGATVLITLKTLAADEAQARELLARVAPAMANLAYPGYILTARYVRSPLIPASGGASASAHIYRLSIERT